MIRFHITKGNLALTTDWEDEPVRVGPQSSAPKRLAELRAEHGPEARIRIERDVYEPRAPQEWVRFVLTHKDGSTQFSNAVLKAEADKLGAEIAADYPNATLSRQEWVK